MPPYSAWSWICEETTLDNTRPSCTTAALVSSQEVSMARSIMANVAQIFNLPYRRIVFGRTSDRSQVSAFSNASQSATLRYSRIQFCATQRCQIDTRQEGCCYSRKPTLNSHWQTRRAGWQRGLQVWETISGHGQSVFCG